MLEIKVTTHLFRTAFLLALDDVRQARALHPLVRRGQVRTRLNVGSNQIVVFVGFGPGLNLGSRTWVFKPRFEQLLLEAELFELRLNNWF